MVFVTVRAGVIWLSCPGLSPGHSAGMTAVDMLARTGTSHRKKIGCWRDARASAAAGGPRRRLEYDPNLFIVHEL